MVGKKRKGRSEVLDVPIDLASRIGGPGPSRPEPAAPEAIRRVDGPIESDRARGRPAMIGANEAPARPVMIGANEVPVRPTMPEPERVASSGRPTMIGLEEAFAVPASITSPAPAFEQVIHGRPWKLLTSDELIYLPRNPRPHKAYGFGPVEQIVMTVNIALRRQAMQLQHFTEGNVPPR